MGVTFKDPQGKVWTFTYPIKRGLNRFLVGTREEDGLPCIAHETDVKGFMPHIPFQKSERAFRRFEPAIRLIVERLPDIPVSVKGENLAVVTTIARLRDAISSLLEYNWNTDIDKEKLAALRPLIEIVPCDDTALVRRKGTKDSLEQAFAAEGPSSKTVFGLELDNPDTETLEAVATLHGKRILNLPTKLTNIPRKVLDDLAARHDIAINEEVDHFILF